MERLNQWLNQNADLLNHYSVLIVLLAALPIALLAWTRRTFPHVSQIAIFSIPVVLTFALLIDKRLLGLLLLVDLFTIPRQKLLTIERQALKIASLQKPHRVTLLITNASGRSFTVWV